jgi:hypothetical protein
MGHPRIRPLQIRPFLMIPLFFVSRCPAEDSRTRSLISFMLDVWNCLCIDQLRNEKLKFPVFRAEAVNFFTKNFSWGLCVYRICGR